MSITAVFFILVYFIGILKAFINKPIYGLYAYLFTFYMDPISRWWGVDVPKIRWSLIAAVITLIALVIYNRKNGKEINWFKQTETKLIFAFALFVILQSFWALRLDLHMEYVVLVLKFVILMILIQNCIQDEKDLILFMMINLGGCCYYAYLAQFTGGGRLEVVGGNALSDANLIAQHVSVILVMSSYLLLCKLGWKTWLIIPMLVLALNVIMKTESRAALIAIAATGIYSLFYIPSNVKKKFLLLATLAAIAFSILMGPQILQRFKTMTANEDGQGQDKSAAGKIVIINSQLDMFLDNPILGYGHRGTLLLSPVYIPRQYHSSTGGGRASHNLFMSLLVDHGLIGASLYFLVIWRCIRKISMVKNISTQKNDAFRLKVLLTGLVMSLVCLMIAGLASNSKKLEIDIWLYALIPLTATMLTKRTEKHK